jgi:hypothetical protein
MKTLAFLLAFAISGSIAFAEKPEPPVKVYCFSADLAAGFKDIDASCYCVELGKKGEKKKSLTITNVRETAQITIEYLGSEQFQARGEATYLNYGIAWTPSETKNREAVVLSVGRFSKAFSAEGINAQASGKLVRQTEEWIRRRLVVFAHHLSDGAHVIIWQVQ